jgi:alkaline phosphatase
VGCHKSIDNAYDSGARDDESCPEAVSSVRFEDPLPDPDGDVDAGDDDAGSDDDDAGRDPGAEEGKPFRLPPTFECEGEASLDAAPQMARNVIFLLGDGMGPGQVEAARRLGRLHLDTLPARGALNTDSLNTDADPAIATDSAASATAFASGVRTLNGRLGLDGAGEPVPSVLDLAQEQGKAVGLVTTSYLYDASPMAFAVHSPDRFANNGIIEQLFSREPIDVLMGGGAGLLGEALPAVRQRALALDYTLVLSAFELELYPLRKIERLLGLFSPVAAPGAFGFPTTPICERTDRASDPSLPDMTERALEILSRDDDGFFLFVENENTDSYAHLSFNDPEVSAARLPYEVRYLDEALGVALRWVKEHSSFDETLIVLTADHDTGGFDPGDPDAGEGPSFLGSAHTRTPVGVYARGPGAKHVEHMCRMSELYLLLSGRLR